MTRILFVLLTTALMLLGASAASAQDAGTTKLTTAVGGGGSCDTIGNGVCFYEFTTAVHSAVFRVLDTAKICLRPGSVGDGRVKIHEVDTAATNAGSHVLLDVTLDGVASTDTACIYNVQRGYYYVEVSTAETGAAPKAYVRVEGS